MAGNQQLKTSRTRSYVAKDFDSFRSDLLRYARTYFGDKIQDFSEPSLGGLLLDMAASVSDSMSFYLDHQFREMSWSTVVENTNLIRMIRESGLKPKGASPSVVSVSIFIEVPAKLVVDEYVPDDDTLPIIKQSTQFSSNSGILFAASEDVDFSERDRNGDLVATYVTGETDDSGNPLTFVLKREVTCVSGQVTTDTFNISSDPVPFFTITLLNTDISEIMEVVDSSGNQYYEVQTLSQDTVFRTFPNFSSDSEEVPRSIELIPAPRRFVSSMDPNTRITTIQFGGGTALTTQDDSIPDPETLALPLYGTTTFSRFSLDPNSLLQTKTLGVRPNNTKISVTYRYGGGASHNVASRTIRGVSTLLIEFPDTCSADNASSIRASVDVRNDEAASGGSSAPTLEDLRSLIPASRTQQDRIVTKEDLVSRVYTLPTKLGRVYRASAQPNPGNPLACKLYICSKDRNGFITTASDSLKNNLKIYLNEFRLISDAVEILDANPINIRVRFNIFVNPNSNKTTTTQAVITQLSDALNTSKFQIDQPILISDLQNAVINTPGVLSLVSLEVENVNGTVQDRSYSNTTHSIKRYTKNGIIYGPAGSIFELRYPLYDIIGTAI
jgi:hypothetical protein